MYFTNLFSFELEPDRQKPHGNVELITKGSYYN